MTTLTCHFEHPFANVEKAKENRLDLFSRPTTGKTTRMGRKVEKPRDPKSGGPSGQKDRGRHDTRHTNK